MLMLSMIAYNSLGHSNQNAILAPTQDRFPRLIALEPTSVRLQATAAPSSPTTTVEPHNRYVEIPVSFTPTPLTLSAKHQAEILGFSTEGRPLALYTFGSGEHERMLVAGIHGGDEWNTVTLANQLIKHMNQNSNIIPDDVTLYLLPNLNPDGEARAHDKYGRLNHNGVDLNRNFPINWQQDWDRGGCWHYLSTSGGTGPGSEAETQVLMNFIEAHNIEALISYHSAALGIFPGGLPPDPGSTRL